MKTSDKCTVMLVDDHVILRDALAATLNNTNKFRVIGTLSNGLELMEKLELGQIPDVIVLDLNMPKMNGYEVANVLHEKYPSIKTLVLTMYDSEIALVRLLQIGIKGFLKKDVNPHELQSALNVIADDGFYYSSNTTGKLANFFQKSRDSAALVDRVMLSPKELEFLELASTEMTYKEIADKMKLTPRAVDCCRDNLFSKLEIKSRVGLVLYAVKHGIVRL